MHHPGQSVSGIHLHRYLKEVEEENKEAYRTDCLVNGSLLHKTFMALNVVNARPVQHNLLQGGGGGDKEG